MTTNIPEVFLRAAERNQAARAAPAGAERDPTHENSRTVLKKHGGGPRTAEGKRTVARNPITHGLTSASPVAGGEDEIDWQRSLENWRQDLQPVGAAQEALVYMIASADWRKRRAIRYENRLIDAHYEQGNARGRRVSTKEEILDKLDCDLEVALDLLEHLEEFESSVVLDSDELTNALYVPAVLCIDGPLPEWLVFPRAGDVWTCADVERWITAFAEHLKITPGKLMETTITKARTILRERRIHRIATETPGWQTLFRQSAGIELNLRYEKKFDRDIERGMKLLKERQDSKRRDPTPPSDDG